MTLSFHPPTPADVPALLDLIQQLYTHEGIPCESDQIENAVWDLLGDSSAGQIWLMRADGMLVGYFVLTFVFVLEFAGRCAVIDELFVVSDQRGKGYGTQALRRIEATCREAGYKALRLEVEHTNNAARELYLKFGFRPHDRSILTKPLRH